MSSLWGPFAPPWTIKACFRRGQVRVVLAALQLLAKHTTQRKQSRPFVGLTWLSPPVNSRATSSPCMLTTTSAALIILRFVLVYNDGFSAHRSALSLLVHELYVPKYPPARPMSFERRAYIKRANAYTNVQGLTAHRALPPEKAHHQHHRWLCASSDCALSSVPFGRA